MIVQHNLNALSAERLLGVNNGQTAKALEKLASGYRINRAGDDAAGLAISETMRSQIRGLETASKNASHGINLIQTAEGGLEEIHSMLQRMRELAVQATNGTYLDEIDRENLNAEVDALKGEINRIARSVHYNGITLLDGTKSQSAGKITLNGLPGILAAMRGALDPGEVGLVVYNYGYGDGAIDAAQSTGSDLFTDNITAAQYDWLRNDLKDVYIPNIVNSMLAQYTCFDFLAGSSIGIGLRLFQDPSGPDGSVSASFSGDSAISLTLSINVDSSRNFFDASGQLQAGRRADFEALVAHEMMHAFMDIATSNGMASSDSFPDWFIEGMAQTAGGHLNWVDNAGPGSPALTGNSSDADIKAVMSNLGRTDTIHTYKTGYLAMMYLGYMAAGGGAITAQNILDGVNKLMVDIIGGMSLDNAIANNTTFSSTKDFEDKVKNGTATGMCNFVRGLVAAGKEAAPGAKGSLLTGNLAADDIVDDNNPGPVKLFELSKDTMTIRNTYPAGTSIWIGGGLSQTGAPPYPGYNPRAPRLGGILLQIGANGTAPNSMMLFIEGCTTTHLDVDDANVSTRESANEAITLVDDAINYVSGVRSQLGAYQNRLEHTISNLENTRENLAAAESKIRDTDMAKQMMHFVRANVMVQSAQAMLAQANQLPQSVLQLLR